MIPIDYNANYFGDALPIHPAGYSNYGRYPFGDADDPDNLGELFKTQHRKFFNRHKDKLQGARVLDVGCGKGQLVKDLRDFGVNARGIDISQHAITNSEAPLHCDLRDARIPSNVPNNFFDLVICNRFLPCLTDAELAIVIPEIRRIGRFRLAIVDDLEWYESLNRPDVFTVVSDYYNIKTQAQWETLCGSNFIVESVRNVQWLYK